MSKTISEFLQFVKSDPIMLALCLAIGVLLVLFIIVLLLGKKSDKKDKKEENVLKTQVDLNVIKDASSVVKDNPIFETDSFEDKIEPIPVETSEPVKIEVPVENPNVFPQVNASNDDSLSKLTESESIVFEQPTYTKQDNVNSEIIESSVSPVEPKEELVFGSDNLENHQNNDFPNFMDVMHTEAKSDVFPTLNEAKPQFQETQTKEETSDDLKDIYSYEQTDIPEVKTDEFSRTAIINRVFQNDEKATPVEEKTEEDDDDIVLPKLNTVNQSNSAFDIMGESFDVPKNS